jgi:2-methylcitrate dehydratase
MDKELQNYQIAGFSLQKRYSDLGTDNIDQLKRHLLDSMGSMLHATQKPSIAKLARQLSFLEKSGPCKVPLLPGLSFDRAAQLYTALIRYPDFMDNYMGKEATCHPSDNIGVLLAASQIRKTSGKEFLTAMAISYQVECRLVEEIPVMMEGMDHTLFLAYSMVAGMAQLLGLTKEQTAHALGISGCSISPLVTSRASYTYEWKGFASSLEALNSMNIALLAREGMTGPIALFEGPKGFKEIFDMNLEYDWSKESFDLVRKCVLKRYNAEVHSQSTIEALLELRDQHSIDPREIEKIDITTFLTAYHIIGSGAYGDRKKVETKEQADHSLFYLVAVAFLDGDIYPEQFEPARIKRKDVQDLLQKVFVKTGFPLHKPLKLAGVLDPYTEAYPDKLQARVEITLKNGKTFTCEKEDYHGFFTRPFDWDYTIEKFKRLTRDTVNEKRHNEIIDTIQRLDKEEDMSKLIGLLCIESKSYEPVTV